MMKRNKLLSKIGAFLLIFTIGILGVGCNSKQKNGADKNSGSSVVEEDHYLFFSSPTYTLKVGYIIEIELFRVNVEGAATWESSQADVATVENGKITAVSSGETTITASVGEYSTSCKVIVQGAEEKQNIIFEYEEKHLTNGEEFLLLFTLENAEIDEVEFSLSNKDIITYQLEGEGLLITAEKAGVVTLSAVVGSVSKTVTFYIISKECSKLPTPENLRISEGILYWESVENAVKYSVKVDDGAWIDVAESQYKIPEGGWTNISVRAIGDGIYYSSSDSGMIDSGAIWNADLDPKATNLSYKQHISKALIVEDEERGNVLQLSYKNENVPQITFTTSADLSNVESISYWIKVVSAENKGAGYVPNIPGSGIDRADGFALTKTALGKDDLTAEDGWEKVTISGLKGVETKAPVGKGKYEKEQSMISYDENTGLYTVWFCWVARDSEKSAESAYTIYLDDIQVEAYMEKESTYKIYYDLGACQCSNISVDKLTQEISYGETVSLLIPNCDTHRFLKWVVRDTGGEYNENTYERNEDLYLVAIWGEYDKEEESWTGWI